MLHKTVAQGVAFAERQPDRIHSQEVHVRKEREGEEEEMTEKKREGEMKSKSRRFLFVTIFGNAFLFPCVHVIKLLVSEY